jgi:hypothetical protein
LASPTQLQSIREVIQEQTRISTAADRKPALFTHLESLGRRCNETRFLLLFGLTKAHRFFPWITKDKIPALAELPLFVGARA